MSTKRSPSIMDILEDDSPNKRSRQISSLSVESGYVSMSGDDIFGDTPCNTTVESFGGNSPSRYIAQDNYGLLSSTHDDPLALDSESNFTKENGMLSDSLFDKDGTFLNDSTDAMSPVMLGATNCLIGDLPLNVTMDSSIVQTTNCFLYDSPMSPVPDFISAGATNCFLREPPMDICIPHNTNSPSAHPLSLEKDFVVAGATSCNSFNDSAIDNFFAESADTYALPFDSFCETILSNSVFAGATNFNISSDVSCDPEHELTSSAGATNYSNTDVITDNSVESKLVDESIDVVDIFCNNSTKESTVPPPEEHAAAKCDSTDDDGIVEFAGASNYTHLSELVSLCYLELTVGVAHTELLADFLRGTHVLTKFLCSLKGVKRKKRVIFSDLIFFLENNLKLYGQITVEKVQTPGAVKKFTQQDVSRKRAVAACSNIIHGLSLHELHKALKADSKLTSKQRNNRFSHFQRADRKGGKALEEEFSAKHNVFYDTDFDIIEKLCETSLLIFNEKGYLEKFSGNAFGNKVQFYKTDLEIFLVRNFQAFCKF